MKRSAFAALFFLAIFLPALLGCGPSAKERTVIAKLTESMETHCMGRLLIDLPKGFVESQGSRVQLIYGLDKDWTSVEVQVLAKGVDKAGFEAHVKKRAAEISSETHEPTRGAMLVATNNLSETSMLFRRFRSDTTEDAFVNELYVLIGDLLVQAKEESFEGKYAPTEARLKKLATQMSKQADPTKASKGFCLGPLVINGEQDHEVGMLYFDNPQFPDIGWNVFSQALTNNEDKTLLQRWDSKQGVLAAMGMKFDTLRRGPAQLAGMKGEELLTKGKEHDRTILAFDADVSTRPQPGFAAPLLAVHLTTGNQLPGAIYPESSWSDKEAIAVWDTVIKSIRLRPGAV